MAGTATCAATAPSRTPASALASSAPSPTSPVSSTCPTPAPRALQFFLLPAARAMRGVPGLHVPGVLQSGQVMVADDRRAFTALRPVAAGGVAARCREIPGRVRARQDIVHVHGIAAAADQLALLRQSGLLVDVVA